MNIKFLWNIYMGDQVSLDNRTEMILNYGILIQDGVGNIWTNVVSTQLGGGLDCTFQFNKIW